MPAAGLQMASVDEDEGVSVSCDLVVSADPIDTDIGHGPVVSPVRPGIPGGGSFYD